MKNLHYKTFRHPKPHFVGWHTCAHKIVSYKVWLRQVKPAFRPMNRVRFISSAIWNASHINVVNDQ